MMSYSIYKCRILECIKEMNYIENSLRVLVTVDCLDWCYKRNWTHFIIHDGIQTFVGT